MDATERLRALLARRSVSPRRLGRPAPSPEQIVAAVGAALRAPDHGGLVPWRVVLFDAEQRGALGRLFVEEKLRRDPLASATDLSRASAHATAVPALLAFVVSPRASARTPLHEQWLAAGAALMNLLNGFDALGFGAILLSGDRCGDAVLRDRLGVRTAETLAGFLSIGTVVDTPSPAVPKPTAPVLSVWQPDMPAAAALPDAATTAVGRLP